MLTEQYSSVLPGFEELHVGLRQCVCECGCGETFFQSKVGRVRKYMNDAHKRKAYRNKGAVMAQNVVLEIDQLKELLTAYAEVVTVLRTMLDYARGGQYETTLESFMCEVEAVLDDIDQRMG